MVEQHPCGGRQNGAGKGESVPPAPAGDEPVGESQQQAQHDGGKKPAVGNGADIEGSQHVQDDRAEDQKIHQEYDEHGVSHGFQREPDVGRGFLASAGGDDAAHEGGNDARGGPQGDDRGYGPHAGRPLVHLIGNGLQETDHRLGRDEGDEFADLRTVEPAHRKNGGDEEHEGYDGEENVESPGGSVQRQPALSRPYEISAHGQKGFFHVCTSLRRI